MRGIHDYGGRSQGITRRAVLSQSIGLGTAATLNPIGFASAQETTAGEGIWQFETGSFVVSSPTIVDGTVYVGSNDGTVYAVDAETGEKEWAFTEPGEAVRSSPTVVDDVVYVGADNGTLYAITADNGEEEWSQDLGIQDRNSPVVTDGVVYVGAHSEGVYALDAENGSEEWHFELDFIGQASPIVADGTVYIGSALGGSPPTRVYAIDAQTGNEEWVFEAATSGGTETSPAVEDGTLYIGEEVSDGRDETYYHLRAIDTATGETEWTFETDGRPNDTPTVADGTVYVGTVIEEEGDSEFRGVLHAVDTALGEERWQFANDASKIASSPTVAGGNVYFGTNGVYAIGIETGAPQWQFGDPAIARSSPTVVDGIVFAGLDDSSLYAIDAGVDGSSEDSRVLQGVLGHHNEWAGEEPQTLDPVVSYSPGNDDSGGGDGPVGAVFQTFSGPTDSPLFLGIAGAVGAVTAYAGYRLLNRDHDQPISDTTVSPSSKQDQHAMPEAQPEYPSATTYEELEISSRIIDLPTAQVHRANIHNTPVWVLEPATEGETIEAVDVEFFHDRVRPWVRMDPHPNLLRVLGSGESPLPWVAFEPAGYPPVIDSVDEFSIAEIFEILKTMCEAIHHVHRYGTQYRNLTTESLVRTNDDTILLRSIIDQFEASDQWYQAPEKFTNEPTEQSSVYRVGIIAYELLTGTLPYSDAPDGDSRIAIQNSLPIPPSEQADGISEQIDMLLLKALEKDPADRFETILHLRDEIDTLSVTSSSR